MKARTVVFLVATLILGFILGFFSSSWIRYHRMKEFRSFASTEGFRVRELSIIEPTEEQTELLIPVIHKFAGKNMELKKEYRDEFISLMKEYRSELYPLLSAEQIERLESRKWKSKGFERGSRGPHKMPPPGDPPRRQPFHDLYFWFGF